MNSSRRVFLTQATVVAGSIVLAKQISPVPLGGKTGTISAGAENTVTVYHTNSINGNVGPVYKNAGGLRKINTYLMNGAGPGLLLDAGNFLSPGGGFEEQKQLVATMNGTGYWAAGISGLDLSDGGRLLTALNPLMQFSLINCNHTFSASVKSYIKPYHAFKSSGIKIGITAVCMPIKGAAYKDAVECANRTARFLKEDERCHLVICLSDLGPTGQNPKLNDHVLAETSENIDLVIGNDHGKFHNNDMVMRNKLKHEVVFSAAAANGLTIGKTVVNFSGDKTKNGLTVEHLIPGKPADQIFSDAMRELLLV